MNTQDLQNAIKSLEQSKTNLESENNILQEQVNQYLQTQLNLINYTQQLEQQKMNLELKLKNSYNFDLVPVEINTPVRQSESNSSLTQQTLAQNNNIKINSISTDKDVKKQKVQYTSPYTQPKLIFTQSGIKKGHGWAVDKIK
ncbi:Hypothetical_protein [Hexamita inflata]|uniref:Hypothetical_protein n=1 Tax=Hexamita inflata TaxID=28002 RepID=A0AA86QTT3_9EUKA|nr:Hypothetical protein HINF_LOCUS47078 [Hexamita inflata]